MALNVERLLLTTAGSPTWSSSSSSYLLGRSWWLGVNYVY